MNEGINLLSIFFCIRFGDGHWTQIDRMAWNGQMEWNYIRYLNKFYLFFFLQFAITFFFCGFMFDILLVERIVRLAQKSHMSWRFSMRYAILSNEY